MTKLNKQSKDTLNIGKIHRIEMDSDKYKTARRMLSNVTHANNKDGMEQKATTGQD